MALADAGHRVLLWCDRIGPGGQPWAEAQIGEPFPDTLHLMQAAARGRTGRKRSAFGTGRERLWHFLRARIDSGPPEIIISRSPTVLRQLRQSRLLAGGTRLILELQYPEWSFLWRDWARRAGTPGMEAAVKMLRKLKQEEAEGYRAADGVLYAARAHESLLRRAAFRGPQCWIPSGAEPPDPGVQPREREFDLGYVGSLAPENGVELLLEAMVRMPSARLLVLGSGRPKYVKRLKARARSLEIEARVEFAGTVPPAAVRGWMRRCRVGVVPVSARRGPEKRQYASPLKLIEWMAAGVPVLASCVPSIRQHHEAGEPMELFEPDDAVSLALSAEALLGDGGRLSRMAELGIEAAHRRSFEARARLVSDFAESLKETAVGGHAP